MYRGLHGWVNVLRVVGGVVVTFGSLLRVDDYVDV